MPRSGQYVAAMLVGADSIETIRQTHAHYFDGVGEKAFDDLLARSTS